MSIRSVRLHLFVWFCALGASLAQAEPPRVQMADVIRAREGQIRDLTFVGSALMATRALDGAEPELISWSGGAATRLGAGLSAAVSPNGRWRLSLNGAEWRLQDLRTGAIRRFALPAVASAYFGPPVWSPDSRTVAAHYDLPTGGVANPNPVKVEGSVRFEDWQPASAAEASAHLFNRPQLLLWSIDALAPTVRALNDTESYAGGWRDAHTYLYAAGRHDYGGHTPYTVVRELRTDTGVERDLYHLPIFNQGGHPRVSPDGRWAAIALDLDTPRFGVANRIVLLDLTTGATRRLADPLTVSQLEWGRDGWIYFTCRDGGLQPLMRVRPDGRVQRLTDDALDHRNLTRSADGRTLAYTTEGGLGRITLRIRDLAGGGERIVATLADPGRRFRLGRFTRVSWVDAAGIRLHGFLFFPPSFDPAGKYPLFVDVHGSGPGAALSLNGGLFGWRGAGPLEWHAWAALGYVVFTPDYRSSGEYGAAVNLARTAATDGDVTGIEADAADVETGVRSVLQAHYLDPHRVVLFGHSAGGGRANYLLTRSALFSAAILHDPIGSGPDADVLSLAAKGLPASWTRADGPPEGQNRLGADFLFDGWRSTTPTLLIIGDPDHGALDPTSAQTLYAILVARHVPTRLIHYLDDGHVPSTPEIAEHQFRQMKAWLDLYAPAAPPA